MVNSFADGKTKLVEPPYGSYIDSWQLPVNSNFGVTDAAVSGTTTINVTTITSASPFVTLVFANFDTSATPWQVPLAGQNLRIVLTGSLSFNITLYIPANVPGMWLIDNQTGGSYTITVQTNATGSVGVNPPQGYISYIFCDGVNVNWADQGNVVAHAIQGTPPGTVSAYAGINIPAGWLLCDGRSYSTSAYSDLFGAIGTTWGGGSGNFNVPNFVGMFLRGLGGNAAALGIQQNDQLGSHTHTATVTDPGHNHKIINGYTGVGEYPVGGPQYPTPPAGKDTSTEQTGITVTNAATGGNETRPVNFGINWIIKT